MAEKKQVAKKSMKQLIIKEIIEKEIDMYDLLGKGI